jgi:predicted amidohydrolase YtcJ
VLSADLMTVPEDQIKDIKAELTIVGGRIAFQR